MWTTTGMDHWNGPLERTTGMDGVLEWTTGMEWATTGMDYWNGSLELTTGMPFQTAKCETDA